MLLKIGWNLLRLKEMLVFQKNRPIVLVFQLVILMMLGFH